MKTIYSQEAGREAAVGGSFSASVFRDLRVGRFMVMTGRWSDWGPANHLSTQHQSEIRASIQTEANCRKFSANFSQTFDDGLIRHAPLSVSGIHDKLPEMSCLVLRVRQSPGLTRTDISALSLNRIPDWQITSSNSSNHNYHVCCLISEKRALHERAVGKFLAFQILLYLKLLQG